MISGVLLVMSGMGFITFKKYNVVSDRTYVQLVIKIGNTLILMPLGFSYSLFCLSECSYDYFRQIETRASDKRGSIR